MDIGLALANTTGGQLQNKGLTCSMLLVESSSLVESKLMAVRAKVKADMVRAVLAMVAASNDWADPTAVAAHPAGCKRDHCMGG